MFRNKICLIIILCLIAVPFRASAQSPNLISEDMIVSNSVNYDMVSAEYGVIEQTFSIKGDVYLPYTYELYPKIGGLKFEGYKVSRDDVVKAGDILAVFTSDVDEVALQEKKLLLERTIDAFALEKESRQAAIDEMYMTLLEVHDSYDAQMLKLKIERAELDFEMYIWRTENEINDIQRAIDEFEEQRADSVITAPVDGIILKTLSRKPGDRIARDELMITMYRTDGALIQVNNKMGNLRYGMPVEIRAGNINSQSIPGRVVGADYMLPEKQQTDMVYVKPDYYDAQKTPTTNIKVSGTTVWLENVLTIPRTAVSLESGKHYVLKFSEGMARKRYIDAELIRQQVMVLQGIEPGEEIIAD